MSWRRFNRKIVEKITNPRNAGYFTLGDATARGVRFAKGEAGFAAEGCVLAFFWLVDPEDGMILDAKFQIFGPPLLIAALDAACELIVGKNYDQATRLGAELIEKKLRDKPEEPAFSKEALQQLNWVLEAIDAAAEMCAGIPLSATYVSPVPQTEEGVSYPNWLSLSKEQKLAVIEKVLTEEVRPYIELDAGGIEVQDLIEDRELIINYQGSCTSCFSAVGATLSTIQQIVQTKIHPNLVVVPNMDALNF